MYSLVKVLTITLFIAFVSSDAPSASYLPPGGGSGGFGGYGGGRGGNGEINGPPQPFNFYYEVKDAESGNDYNHRADSDGQNVKGEYNVLLPDGRKQKVTYTADDQGYNADVQYTGQAQFGNGGSNGGAGGYGGSRPGGNYLPPRK